MTLAAALLILACNKESHLTDPAGRLKASLHDSIPIDSIDTIGHDTIPHDTIPHDSAFRKISGLVITPSSHGDSALKFHIETTNNYPVANSKVVTYLGYSPDSLYVNVTGVQPLFPYTPGSAPAKADVWQFWHPGANVPLTIRLNGRAYTGSVSVAGLNATISWAHDSIILISPKTFPRW